MLAKRKFLQWPTRQNFVPIVNWLLAVGCLSVLIFYNVWEKTANPIEWHRIGPTRPLQKVRLDSKGPTNSSAAAKNPIRSGYLIDTPGCTIWDMKPFDKSVKPYWEPSTADECEVPILMFDNMRLKYNTKSKLQKNASCCIREITRVSQSLDNYTWDADNLYSVNETCIPVPHGPNEALELPEFMLTECKVENRSSSNNIEKIFDYLAAPPSPWKSKTSLRALQNVQYWDQRRKDNSEVQMPPNVLVIGLDSVSRLHFMRSLPLTRKYLLANDFVEMKGYTRIGLNTFPNLMAALGGFELENHPCWKGGKNSFDSCPFIWDQFSARNYVTAFVEDFSFMSTFNYIKSGFVQQPTDYYLRPMGKAYRSDDFRPFQGCVNGGTELEFVLQYMKNLQSSIASRVPYFLLAWMNQAHDYLSTLQKFDLKLKSAVQGSIEAEGIDVNNTIIFVISDHGLRFGGFRETLLGYFEESLPAAFVRLPPAMKARFPEWQRHLEDNGGKLVSPLDFHATLQHIAELDSGLPAPFQANGGPKKYYSFFEEAPNNRSCKDAGISREFCRCGFRPVASKKKPLAKAAASAVTSKLNSMLDYNIGIGLCVSFRYRKLLYLRELATDGPANETNSRIAAPFKEVLIGFETDPVGARFEATLRHVSEDKSPKVQGEIRRIDSYKGQSDCIEDVKLRNYCICRDYVEKVRGS